MDKVTPKDVFAANRDRAAPLLAKLKAEGAGTTTVSRAATWRASVLPMP